MDERLKAISRKGAEIAADPNRDSPPVAQRYIDRFSEIKEAYRDGSWAVGLERGWMLNIECVGHRRDYVSAACHLVHEDRDDRWSRHGIVSSEECREAALEMVADANRIGFWAPSPIVVVSAIADGSVEAGLDTVRKSWRK